MVTYCAGCAHQLSGKAPTSHVLDLLFEPTAALTGKVRVARAPFTYWNRLLLKRSLRKAFAAGACRERTFLAPSGEGRARFPKPLAVLEAVLAAIVAVF